MIPGIVAGAQQSGTPTPTGDPTALSAHWCYSQLALSNGNLTVTHSAATNRQNAASLDAKIDGKWYFEVTADEVSSGAYGIGVGDWSCRLDLGLGATGNNVHFANDGVVYRTTAGSPVTTATGVTYTDGDVIGVAVDMDAREIRFRKNGGAWQGPYAIPGTNPMMPMVALHYQTSAATFNFGATAFGTAAPSGFFGWTENDPADLQGDVWRIQKWVTSSNSGSSIAEVELRLTSGGADQTGGGTATASAQASGLEAPKAIDDNVTTIWGASGSTQWWQVDLSAEMAIRQLALTSRNDFNQHHRDAAVGYSRDGGATFWPARYWDSLSWTNGETKLFDILT